MNIEITTAELFNDSIEAAFKSEQLNYLLNQEPNPKWISVHPFIKNHKYIPIDKVEFMLRKIFKRYRIEITGQGSAFNGVWVTVRVHYLHPETKTLEWHDGIGAIQLQVKKDTSPSDLSNINNGALSMAFPIAKTLAIKDACDHFGKLFGCDLNRRDTIPFQFDKNLKQAGINIEEKRLKLMLADCETIEDIELLQQSMPDYDAKIFDEYKNNLK